MAFFALAVAALTMGEVRATEFSPHSVRLLPSPFLQAQKANGEYLLRLEVGRLLHGFYMTAGLPTQGERYGGWESQGVAGHTLGHYLTACSYQWAATGDERFRDRVVTIVRELARCQEKRTDGNLGAIPDGNRIWAEVRRGDIRSQGFDLNGGWVPWYTMHKLFAGLLDAQAVAGVEEALPVVRRLGEWALDVTGNLNTEQWQRMLACEHGGMNESLAELSVRAGDPRFLDLARRFHHDAVLNPLKAGEDRLAGLHSNTQIPKVIGLARLYELEARAEDREAAEFFWDRVVKHRSYAIGGNSDHEHLGPPDRLRDALSANTAETCNTYNLLKLTRHLYAWEPDARRFDFYERALTNHILTSQRPHDGMLMYYVPLAMGSTKPFSTPFDSFWCCVGTGIENHARYGEAIYARHPDGIAVNLFIPSTLDTDGVKLRLEGGFPLEGRSTLSVDRADGQERTFLLRRPDWCAGTPRIRINGRGAKPRQRGDGYVALRRRWKAGDRVEIEFPMTLAIEAMPDDPNRVALRYGPVVLAARHPAGLAPVLIPGRKSVSSWLKRIPGEGLRFRSNGIVRPNDLEFEPFFGLIEGTYSVYFDRFTEEAWRKREREIREAEAQRLAEERATVDAFRPGEMQDERDHAFTGERVETGEHQGRKWRHAAGGWFSFRLKTDPGAPQVLVLDYWTGDRGREFSISVDGKRIAGPPSFDGNPRFASVRYPLDPAQTADGEVVVRFDSAPGSLAGGLYGARTVRLDLLKEKL